jgi:mono/diheme cytochrome c family protein
MQTKSGRKTPLPAVFLSALATLLACGEDTSQPGNQISFSQQIQPIFTASCALSGCHGSGNLQPPEKPMNLSAGQAYTNTVNVSSAQLGSMDRIEPGQPDQSYLVHKIQGTHLQVGGSGVRMPAGGSPLSQSQIDLIRTWIAQGAANN